ncbi:MAG: hypothetical protein QHH02_07685, partial [Syntrophomonadaceae bacterium]|nr:hypothetical protein [Syntrophomonadaceae bacterium]
TSWWSAAFPGYGYIALGSYIKGFLLIGWEFLVNINAKLNLAIMYSLTSRFEQAKEVLDLNWFILYVAVYIISIWMTYGLTVDLNKLCILAEREDSPVLPVSISAVEICYLDKRNPWIAAMISLLYPGLGHLYTHRVPTSFFLLANFFLVAHFSRLAPAIHYTFVGAFEQATAVLDPQWLLFLPSLYGFAIHDSWVNCIEYNKLFEMEQSRFLRDNYQQPDIYHALEEVFEACLC